MSKINFDQARNKKKADTNLARLQEVYIFTGYDGDVQHKAWNSYKESGPIAYK